MCASHTTRSIACSVIPKRTIRTTCAYRANFFLIFAPIRHVESQHQHLSEWTPRLLPRSDSQGGQNWRNFCPSVRAPGPSPEEVSLRPSIPYSSSTLKTSKKTQENLNSFYHFRITHLKHGSPICPKTLNLNSSTKVSNHCDYTLAK